MFEEPVPECGRNGQGCPATGRQLATKYEFAELLEKQAEAKPNNSEGGLSLVG